MKEPDGHALELDRQLLGELASQLRAVDVAVDSDDPAEVLQLGEDLAFAEVAQVNDQVGVRSLP
jgi:hypothetical protein